MINGAPYSPQSQGIVERIHTTIRQALLSKFLDDQTNFDIKKDLSIIMNIYNNSVHRITRHTPNEVFYSENKDLFLEVYNNILNFYKQTQKDNIMYNQNEKVLLINNIIKSKKKNKKGYYILSINKVKKIKVLIKFV